MIMFRTECVVFFPRCFDSTVSAPSESSSVHTCLPHLFIAGNQQEGYFRSASPPIISQFISYTLRNSLFLVFIICTYLVIFSFHTATIWFHATFCYLPLSDAGHLMKISSDFGITFSLDSLTLTVVACLSSCLPAHPQHWNSGCRRTCSSWASCLHSQVRYSTKVLFLSFPSPLRPLTDFSLSFSTFPSWDSYSPFSRPIPVFTHVSPLKFCAPEINHWKHIFAPHCVLHLGPNFVPATWP